MAGVPLAVVGKILGHRKPETTARYAHIADSVMSDAVDAMSRAIRHGTKTGKRLKTG
jgi:site-specific recombinase XerD